MFEIDGLTPVNAPSWLTERPIAHRGLHDATMGVIENTLAAAEAAIGGGFAIECDIQLSADGEAIVFHDETLDRLTDAIRPCFGLERGGNRKNPDQGDGRAAADLRRVSRKGGGPDAGHLRAQERVRRRLAHRRPRRRPRGPL